MRINDDGDDDDDDDDGIRSVSSEWTEQMSKKWERLEPEEHKMFHK